MRNLILSILFGIYPTYLFCLWLFVFYNIEGVSQAVRVDVFNSYLLVPSSGLVMFVINSIFPIIAGGFIIKWLNQQLSRISTIMSITYLMWLVFLLFINIWMLL